MKSNDIFKLSFYSTRLISIVYNKTIWIGEIVSRNPYSSRFGIS